MVTFFDNTPTNRMHASDLVELAAIVAAHGDSLISGCREIPKAGLEQYWTASKCRFDRWGHKFKEYQRDGRNKKPLPTGARAVVEEILTGEALTRVWAATACSYDRHRGREDFGNVVTSVLNGHLEARHRALRLLADADPVNRKTAQQLTRLHRRVARWVDLLIAYLPQRHDVSRFAINPQRCCDFAQDLRREARHATSRQTWTLTLASLRDALCRELSELSPNSDLNFTIGISILSCFDTSQFESIGALRSLWLIRLSENSAACERLIERLLDDQP